jgi:hypothetical protein
MCLSNRSWQNNGSPFCHTLHTYLISHRASSFSFLAWKKSTWASVSVGWEDRHCHKESSTGPSCKYFSAFFPAAILTLADLHCRQWRLFWGRVNVSVSCIMVRQNHSPRNNLYFYLIRHFITFYFILLHFSFYLEINYYVFSIVIEHFSPSYFTFCL